jgi:hypothetical protein
MSCPVVVVEAAEDVSGLASEKVLSSCFPCQSATNTLTVAVLHAGSRSTGLSSWDIITKQ